MALYLTGDIQGCYNALCRVLEKAKFDQASDKLWCLGDLVNRGGQSRQTLELLYALRAKVVLGNHDLFLLKAWYCSQPAAPNKDLQNVMNHPNCHKWLEWLRRQPLYHHDVKRNLLLVHAGLPHIWTLAQACQFAEEASAQLVRPNNWFFWDRLFGNKPQRWKHKLSGFDRTRLILNYFTRMRYISKSGKLNLKRTDKPPARPVDKYLPWYAHRRSDNPDLRIAFGHWASLDGKLVGRVRVDALPLDTGCVWGGRLTLYNLDSGISYTAKQRTKKIPVGAVCSSFLTNKNSPIQK